MKKTNLYILAVSFVLAVTSLKAQQQTLYTNYLFNSYAYNAGVVGSLPYTHASIYYRNQWTGFDGAPKTYMFSLQGNLKKVKNSGIGGMLIGDNNGLISTTTGYLTFAYHVKINKKTKLGLGVSAGAKQYRVRLYDVRAYDQGDEYLTGNIMNGTTFDANAGLYLYGEKLFAGFSAMTMLNNKINWKAPNGRITPHYYGIIGYNYKFKKDYAIQPSVLVKYNDPAPVQLEYSLKFTYKDWIWLGASYRQDDATAAMVGFTFMKKINVAYAYDFTMSNIRKYSNGSHEICLSYSFIKKKSVNAADEEEFKILDNSMKQSIKNKKTTQSGEQKKEEAALDVKQDLPKKD